MLECPGKVTALIEHKPAFSSGSERKVYYYSQFTHCSLLATYYCYSKSARLHSGTYLPFLVTCNPIYSGDNIVIVYVAAVHGFILLIF